MTEVLLLVMIVLLLVGVCALLVRVYMRCRPTGPDPVLPARLEALERALDGLGRALREESSAGRSEQSAAAGQLREELARSMKDQGQSLRGTLETITHAQRSGLDGFSTRLGQLTASVEQKLDALRGAVDSKLQQIQQDNHRQLEEMRKTVDEKLQGALERRLGESFKQVSERLEQVHQGLGQMQGLAAGVGDLKRVLTNVKTRGTWGEWQLGALLEQMLTPEQYVQNVATRPGANERVEFAICLPGRDGEEPVLLPIDAKFPMEDYQRLVAATEAGDAAGVEDAVRQLEQRVRACAREIRDKYINPPLTTDFAILYLPTEALYAEVARRAGLIESLQRDCRVTVTGPTTLAAMVNSLQMGFRTLSIQKRSAEVWRLLAQVKNEFAKFGEVISGVQKKLDEASRAIEDKVAQRTRVIEKRLAKVHELPPDAAMPLDDAPAAPHLPDNTAEKG